MRKLLLATIMAALGVAVTVLAIRAIGQPEGRTLKLKYGAKSTYVVRAPITGKRIALIGSAAAERSENAAEQRIREEQLRHDKWTAFFDVDVRKWVEGRGTHGNGPKSIVITHSVAFTDEDRPAAVWSSGDWEDRTQYDKLQVGKEYEFHVHSDVLYGKYYALVQAYPVVNGSVEETSIEGFRGRDYRFERFTPDPETPPDS